MSPYEERQSSHHGAQGIDAIGCAGSLLVFMVILFVLGSILGGTAESETRPTAAQLAAGIHPSSPTAVSANVSTASTTAALVTTLPTPTLLPATATPTPSPTNTATATATQTKTAVSANRPLPTNTPIVLPTPTPLPLPTPRDAYSWTLKAPILMYHYISTPPADADKYRIDLSVTPENFRAQMAYLAANGYTAVDLYDLSRAIANQQELPPKPVIITLDDGYRDHYENAFPVLREYGMTATIFIITEFIDQGYEPYLTWPMVKEMAAAGIRFEPHSKNHPDLRGQDRDFLIWEILGSQETVAAHIGYTPRYFAYPGGRYDSDTIQVLRELDFWGAVTTTGGAWHSFDDRYEWTRVRIRHTTTIADFADLVDLGNTVGGRPR